MDSIDALLAAGRSARSLAVEFGISNDSMKRHARNHPNPRMTHPPIAPPDDPGAVRSLYGRLESQMRTIEREMDKPDIAHRQYLDLARELRLIASELSKHQAPEAEESWLDRLQGTTDYQQFMTDIESFLLAEGGQEMLQRFLARLRLGEPR